MSGKIKGFTLVESLIALLFLTIAMVPIAALLESFYRKSYDVRETGVGLFLAQKLIEEEIKKGYSGMSVSNVTTAGLSDFPEFTLVCEISKDTNFIPSNTVPHSGSGDALSSFKRVKATVFWGPGRGERVELVHIQGNY